ncbi:hypothetical protein GGH92_003087 [Coemansia sp. RSA 2673]|nr:hypothetical protein GGH92_003087 [Coemansia sp. RSA 2673]
MSMLAPSSTLVSLEVVRARTWIVLPNAGPACVPDPARHVPLLLFNPMAPPRRVSQQLPMLVGPERPWLRRPWTQKEAI